jgi:hypothetical protein
VHVAHALKPLAAAVFAYADGTNTPAEIAELVSYRLDTTVTEVDVTGALEQLEATSLLATPLLDVQTGVSRRTALKTFAAAGAGSMLVMSVATSAASACITCGSVPSANSACTKNTYDPNNPQEGLQGSDCKLCEKNGPCFTKGSNAACCCAPCDGSGVQCCQPICLITSSGNCPATTLPVSVTVGGENSHQQIVCPAGYGAFQGSGYSVKCCLAGTAGGGNTNNGSTYCECTDSSGTCGEWVGTTHRGKPTTWACQIYT